MRAAIFELLQPAPALYERPGVKPNALSCVLRVSGGGRSALLTGDIERDDEAAMVVAYGAALRSDVLIAPHHGSKTSSSAAFLDAVQPRIAVMQAGYRNRYGHPSPAVLASYRERGIHVMLSASCGAWRWRPGVQSCQRDIARRSWQHVWHHPDLPQYKGSGLELADPN